MMWLLLFGLSLIATLLGAAAALAQEAYPTKAITIVVPFAPGGGTDTSARWVGQELSERLGQPVIIENRPGASGALGAEYVARARPDGYTLLVSNMQATAVMPSLMKLNYNAETAFAPISELAELPLLLLVNAALPVRTTAEFIALAKAKPGGLKYGAAGSGSSTHLAAAMFEAATGIKVLQVPYEDDGLAMQDLMAGQVDFPFLTVPESTPAMKTGKLRPIAVTSATRSAALPGVPTLAESGLPGYQSVSWSGMFAPAETSLTTIYRLARAVMDIVLSLDMSERLLARGATPVGSMPAQFRKFIKSETARYKKLIAEHGIKASD